MSLRVSFERAIEVGDWHIENIVLEEWSIAHSLLSFNASDSDYADELDAEYYVRVPFSNIIAMVD